MRPSNWEGTSSPRCTVVDVIGHSRPRSSFLTPAHHTLPSAIASMATTTSRIWERPSEPAPSNHSSRSAQLPSITTLTQALPATNGSVTSPTYQAVRRERDSDQWPSQPQSTRKQSLSRRCSCGDVNRVRAGCNGILV